MRKSRFLKTLYVFLIGLAMVTAPAAYAATNDTSVVNSGNDANVNANATQNSSVSVSNTNTATVMQDVNANSNTGGNDANHNIGGSSISTGNAGVQVMMQTQANKNVTAIDPGTSQASSNMTDVVNTGDSAHVNTSTTTNSNTSVSNENSAFVSQSCGGFSLGLLNSFSMGQGDCSANTGKNDANANIGGAGVTTGNAGVAVGMDNSLNENVTGISGGMGTGLMNNTQVTNTGNHAYVNANATENTNTDVSNSNFAMISQWLNAHANTGYNDANKNIGGASVNTGTAGVETLMGTHANSNLTGIGSGVSPMLSNLDDIVNTGDNLHSNTSVTSNDSASLSNMNALMSSQHVYEYTNSGSNDSNSNVGSSTTGTHMAGVTIGMSTMTNQNSNILGGFLGSLLNMFL